MTHKFADHKHERFGRLEARADDPMNPKQGRHWWLLCDCGNYVSRRATSVLSGRVQSCGCKKKDYLKNLRQDLKGVVKLRLDVKDAFLAGCDFGTEYYNQGFLSTTDRAKAYLEWRAENE